MTSHDVVAYIRKITGIKKVGHTGTLDPGAVGVLPVCIGRATKAAEYITGGVKKYRAEIKLGIITDTADSFGMIIEQKDWKESINIDNYYDELSKVIKSFIGKSSQMPPMYSAVKINGQKLYELARKGTEIERPARQIEIYDISIIDYSKENGTVLFDVVCSKGTYIRVLCEDIGKKLGCGAHMSFLLRTEVSGYKIKDSRTLEELLELSQQNKLETVLDSVETVFTDLNKVIITDTEAMKKLQNGMEICMGDVIELLNDELVRTYFYDKFTAISRIKIKEEKKCIKFEKVF